MTEHVKTPVDVTNIGQTLFLRDVDGHSIAHDFDVEAKRGAYGEIATAVNAYDADRARIAELEAQVEACDGLYDTVQDLRHVINDLLSEDGIDDTFDAVMDACLERVAAYRAALAQVRGEVGE